LAFCTVCKGGEIELDEQTCEERLREREQVPSA
jgi:predicted nucleic acid-binding Zn ribbon protein